MLKSDKYIPWIQVNNIILFHIDIIIFNTTSDVK